ncbi:hypothetical protein DB31_8790 [Hyalangium minutum]|uniref:Uncharacterized protein n=1 Tax=Hyalangium minutum TaxID=394096 RepID=A0A085WI37_9BACT|nr:hypothetical protein DB31_8703 [Hyalangium minutum]KFE67437.1 hypothetical protein DB31_8790 [Hyalangium minutum]
MLAAVVLRTVRWEAMRLLLRFFRVLLFTLAAPMGPQKREGLSPG